MIFLHDFELLCRNNILFAVMPYLHKERCYYETASNGIMYTPKDRILATSMQKS